MCVARFPWACLIRSLFPQRELRAQYAELSARLEAVASGGAELSAALADTQGAVQRVRGAVQERGRDVTQLADMVGSALRAAQSRQQWSHHSAAAGAIGSLGFGSYAPISAAGASASAAAAADHQLEVFDSFVRKLHRRVGEVDPDDGPIARRRHHHHSGGGGGYSGRH